MRQVDIRREHRLRERMFREREGALGAQIAWYCWDENSSVQHNIYDEAGQNSYHPKKLLPILWHFDEEGGDRVQAEGRELWRTMHMAVTIQALRNVGITPEPDERINDLILFRGWWWDITNFSPSSQSSQAVPHTHYLPGDDATARITAKRRFPLSDYPEDLFPPITGVVYPEQTYGSL